MKGHRRPQAVSALLIVAALAVSLSGCDDNSSTAHTTSDTPPHLVEGPATPLEPGTYQFSVAADVETPEALVDVPDGFEDEAAWYVVSHDQQQFLGLYVVKLVDRDACHARGDYDPGPSVKDLADALVAQGSTHTTPPEPVTLAGHHGLYVELTSPRDYWSRCNPEAALWHGRGIYNNGQVDMVWILDVRGQRIVVDAAYTPRSSPADIDKLNSMAKSLKFTATVK